MEKLVNSQQLSEHYGVHMKTLLRRIKAGTVPKPIKVGNRNYWPEKAIAEYDARMFAEANA